MDLINVFINTVNKKELPAEEVERTGIYAKIIQFENREEWTSMVSLWNALAETAEGRNFFDKVNEIAGIAQDSVIISLLFLMFKDTFREGFVIDETEKKKLHYAKDKFPNETNYALYLLGLFLGNEHTFESLYDTLPLPVFKEKVLAAEPLPHEPGTEDGNKQNHFPGDTPVDKENGTETVQQEPVVTEDPSKQPSKTKRGTTRSSKRTASGQPTEPSTVAPGVIPGLLQDEPPEPTPEAKQHPDSDVKLPKGGKGRKTVKR